MALGSIDLSALEKQYKLPAGLLSAVQAAESGGNPNAVSPKGALGAFQFMPQTAKAYGINPLDPEQSAVGAARMFSDLSKQFGGDPASMLAAYNWGSGNLTKKGMQNAPAETRNYINKILPKIQPNGSRFGEGLQYADSGQIASDGSDAELEALKAELAALEGAQSEQTDPELAALQAEYEALSKAQPKETQFADKSPLESFGQSLGKGASFGLLDEATAAIMTPFLKEEGKTYGQTYDQLLADARASQSQAEATNPKSAMAGEVIGGIGSGISGGGAASSALAKFSPKLAATIGGAIEANPIKSGAGIGAVSGGVYGFGTGEGSAGSRAENALRGLATGAVAGGVATGVAQNVVKPVVSKVAERFGRKVAVPKNIGTIDDKISEISGQPIEAVKPIPQIAAEKANVLNLPKGVRERDVNLLRLQEEARQGALGDASQVAQRKIDDAIVADVKATTQALIGKETTGTPEDLLLRGIDYFKNQAVADKDYASNLMKLRNDKIANASIYKDYTHQTLTKSIDDLLKSPENAVFAKTQSAKQILEYKKILEGITKPSSGGKFSRPIKFDNLQGWSASVSKFARDAAKSGREQESAVANQMVGKYNNWLDNITESAFKSGDDDLVDQIFKANRNYVDFKNKYGTDKVSGESKLLEDIIKKDALTPDQIVNMTFGKSALGKDTTNQLVGRMLKAVPDDTTKAKMINDFRAGLIMRSYKDALNADGTLRLGTFANKLRDLHQSPAYKTHLSSPEYDAVMKGLYSDISSYVRAINDPTVRSTSGTGGIISRALTKILENPAMRTVTAGQSSNLNSAAQWVGKSTKRAEIKQLERDFFKQLDDAVNAHPTNFIKDVLTAKIGDKNGIQNTFKELIKDQSGAVPENVTLNPNFKKWFGNSKVVDEQGKPLVVYHGTKANFDVFDRSKIGGTASSEGRGFYFTPDKELALGYGEVKPVYLSMKKPLPYDAKPLPRQQLSRIIKDIAEQEAKANGELIADGFLSNYADVRYEGLNKAIKEAVDSLAEDGALDQIEGLIGSGVDTKIVHEVITKHTGYDGIISKGFGNEGKTADIYVAWYPGKIKSAIGNQGTFDPNNPSITGSVNINPALAAGGAALIARELRDMQKNKPLKITVRPEQELPKVNLPKLGL